MNIGSVGGCRLRAHWTLLPALAAAAWAGRLPLLLAALGVVLVHELCHAAVAGLCGFHVGEIELLPVGCVARVDGLFALEPRTEVAIAVAGPVSNLLIVMLLSTLERYAVLTGPWVGELIRINLAVALFNLLPGLPLDGGRIVRAMLARGMGLRRATVTAAWLGFACGVGLAGWSAALFARGTPAWILAMAGILLMILSLRERRTAPWLMLREASGIKELLMKDEALPVRQIVAPATIPLSRLARRFVPHRYHWVLVVDERCAPVGSVGEGQILEALMNRGAMEPLGSLLPRRGRLPESRCADGSGR